MDRRDPAPGEQSAVTELGMGIRMLSQKEKRGKIKICLKWMMALEYDLYASEHPPLKSNMEFYIFLLILDRVCLVFISLVKMF